MHAVRGELEAHLRGPAPLVLDGANGTELERRGVHTGLPLWSSHALLAAPDTVQAIHADYARAGVDVLTANTFRTQRRVLDAAGIGARAGELTRLAVELARAGAAARPAGARVWVAGSAPPLEDCYRPDLVPDDASLALEHAAHAESLAAAGVDLVLVETMNTIREARCAVRATRAVGLPVLVSFVCWQGSTLLSGEPLAEALEAVAGESPIAVGVNCLPPSNVAACLSTLAACGLPVCVYANLGAPDDTTGLARSEDCTAEDFAGLAAGWVAGGARAVGGCCGTTPAHLSAVTSRLRSQHARR
jgi:S-methylmethionine-dependent homocysteine/selenocysteine methylase